MYIYIYITYAFSNIYPSSYGPVFVALTVLFLPLLANAYCLISLNNHVK